MILSIRRWGRIIRGSASPRQLTLAAVLGAMLGFLPGVAQAPGLTALLVTLLLILNANLALAGFAAGLAKLASLALAPVSFLIGRALLDGPTQPLFELLVNAPLLALFGFEYYAAVGGLVLGALFGLLLAWPVVWGLRRLHTRFAAIEKDSAQYQKWMAKGWVRAVLWIFAGGAPKQGYSGVLTGRSRLVRPVGVGVAALVLLVGVGAQWFFSGPLVASALQRGLERANGATVDIGSTQLNLRQGRMTVHGLAMADPKALEQDLLRAAEIDFHLNVRELLRKRVKVDRVVLSEARSGELREVPGELVGPPARPSDPVEPREGERTLEDLLRDAETWKERLAQLRRWVERVSGPAEEEDPLRAPPREPLEERLRRRVAERGYFDVSADHLIRGVPTLTIGQLVAERVRVVALDGETVDVRGENLSTHPHLLADPPRLVVRSSGGTLGLNLDFAGISAVGGQSWLDFHYHGLTTDRVTRHLAMNGAPPLSGGTIDLALNGRFQATGGTYMDMPLLVTVHGANFTLPGAGSTWIEKLDLPLGLRGPIDSPRVLLDEERLTAVLLRAGSEALGRRLREETGRLLPGGPGAERQDGGVGERARDGLGGLLRGRRDGGEGGSGQQEVDPQ